MSLNKNGHKGNSNLTYHIVFQSPHRLLCNASLLCLTFRDRFVALYDPFNQGLLISSNEQPPFLCNSKIKSEDHNFGILRSKFWN